MRRFVKLKLLGIFLLLTLATLQVLPSLASVAKFELPDWIASTFTRKFQLGLDLQGGLHLEYSVAVDEALENKLDQIAGELESAFKEKKDLDVEIERKGIDTLDIIFASPDDVALATEDVMAHAADMIEDSDSEALRAEGIIRLIYPEERIAENRKAVVGQALETVRRRVDAAGVAEPNIYPKNRQIVIELPGVSDTASELRAAVSQVSTQFSEILSANSNVQVRISDVGEDPGAIDIVIPDNDARALIKTAFGAQKLIPQDDGSQLLVDLRHFARYVEIEKRLPLDENLR